MESFKGVFSVTKAAWDIMREQKYGRVVNITSASGLYGNFGQSNYSAAKMGILGFGLTLAKEGSKRNINVNTVAPLALSQMTTGLFEPALLAHLGPQTVAPFVAYVYFFPTA
jgi:NAD(P)-dependent dehydrogenase (short-subunit alcohol dehydrogenase family)